MLHLIEGTDYKYDETYRFYGWEYADEIKPAKPIKAATIGEFYLALLKAWSIETCSERLRDKWSESDPSVGQCTITAKIVHELFGGEVLALPLEGGGMHSFNRIDGKIIDLASEQFGRNALLNFADSVPADPEQLTAAPDKASRCELLRKRLSEYI